MFPILFKIGPLSFHSLSVLIGVGFFVSFFIIWRRLKEAGIEEEKAVDAFLFSSLSAFLTSRIFYIIKNFTHFGFSLTKWLYLNQFPGLSFWGALLGFLIGFAYFSQREKWNFGKIGDELVFGLTPLAFLIQLGMFLDGVNLGGETGLSWGVFFPGDLVRRHPISLFQAFLFLCLWLYLVKIERIWRGWQWYKSQKEGFLLLSFLLFASLFQFLLAFLKPAGLYLNLLEKTASFLLFAAAGGGLYSLSGRKVEKDFLLVRRFFQFKKGKVNGQKIKTRQKRKKRKKKKKG